MIKAVCKFGRTILQNTYFTNPLKVADVTENKNEGTLRLMLMSSSPGILDGDHYQVEVKVEESADVELYTQSYQRLFTMNDGSASNEISVCLQNNASFCYIPHPTVPHKGSCFKVKNTISLMNDSNLIWGEIVTCGRKLNGESFSFRRYHSLTEIFFQNKLILKDNLLLEPFISDPSILGMMEGYSHQATLIFVQTRNFNRSIIDEIICLIEQQQNIMYGISQSSTESLLLRVLGNSAEQLFDCLRMLSGFLKQKINASELVKNFQAEEYAS